MSDVLRISLFNLVLAVSVLIVSVAWTPDTWKLGSMQLISLLAVIGLALVHIFSTRLIVLSAIPRSKWLSFSSGMAVAFVFLALIPGMAADQREVLNTVGAAGFLTKHIYLAGLVGLLTFYGVERYVTKQRQ